MRLTCLKCGQQFELVIGVDVAAFGCVCGVAHHPPEVVDSGTQPNEDAALRSRRKAFRASGVAKNVGGFAIGIALLGVLFFPLGLLGAGIALYYLYYKNKNKKPSRDYTDTQAPEPKVDDFFKDVRDEQQQESQGGNEDERRY